MSEDSTPRRKRLVMFSSNWSLSVDSADSLHQRQPLLGGALLAHVFMGGPSCCPDPADDQTHDAEHDGGLNQIEALRATPGLDWILGMVAVPELPGALYKIAV